MITNFNYKNDGHRPSFLFISLSLNLFLIFFSGIFLCGQDKQDDLKFYSGTIKDSITNIPIEYVNVYVKGTPIGTVTNDVGEFTIKIPASLTSQKITLSIIGYQTKLVKLVEGLDYSNIISLKPSLYQLDEVTVSADKFDSASYLLGMAIKFIKFNFPSKTHLIEGFWREQSFRDTTYTRLIEAAVRVQEIGYQKKNYDQGSMELTRNRIKVIELRKSDDFRKSDLMTKALNMLFGDRNELYMVLNRNYVRLLGKKSKHVLSDDHIQDFDTEYSGKTEWENDPVYKISLTLRQEKNFVWTEYDFYIKQFDFAIVRIEYRSIANPTRKDIKSEWLIDGKYFTASEINYRKINDKYFPVFIHTKGYAGDATPFIEENGVTHKQYMDVIFLLTNVYEDDFSKIKWKDADERDEDVYKNETSYNEKFWENYNTVKLNPLRKSTSSLEIKRSLKEQFKEN